MITSSNGNIFRVTGPLCGEFTGYRWIPLTKASDADRWYFFDLRLNKRLSKHSWGWWFETQSRSLWRHCNVYKWTHGMKSWHWLKFVPIHAFKNIRLVTFVAIVMNTLWACFLSLAWSKIRLCLPGYFSNLACDWLGIVWAYSEQGTENGPWCPLTYVELIHWRQFYNFVWKLLFFYSLTLARLEQAKSHNLPILPEHIHVRFTRPQ